MNQKRSLPGPHHCASLGQTLIKTIFSALQKEAEHNCGALTLVDLQRLEEAFADPQTLMARHYTETYNFCMQSFPNGRVSPFTSDNPLIFYLHARTHETISSLFEKQLQRGGAKWRSIVCHRLGEFLREKSGASINDELTSVYFDLASRKGRALAANDIAGDARGNRILDRAIEQLERLRKERPEIAGSLHAKINTDVRTGFKDASTTDLLIAAGPLDELLSALEKGTQSGLATAGARSHSML